MGPNATRKLKLKNMRCTILVLSLATMVPEDSLYEQDDDLSEAREKISQMQAAGASDKECRELTEKTKKDIETVVTNNQKIIDNLPKGEQCMQLGQAAVLIAQSEKSKADALVVSTQTSVQGFQPQGRVRLPHIQLPHQGQVRHLLLPLQLRHSQGYIQGCCHGSQ